MPPSEDHGVGFIASPDEDASMTDGTPEGNFRDLMLADDPGFAEVMRCVFAIQEHETRAYLELLDRPGSTVSELADDLGKDRSSVNRALTSLLEKGLVRRQHRLLDTGGYVYQYTAIPLAETREKMHDALDEWCAFVHGRIDEFGTVDSEA